jgi:hypothetical protein
MSSFSSTSAGSGLEAVLLLQSRDVQLLEMMPFGLLQPFFPNAACWRSEVTLSRHITFSSKGACSAWVSCLHFALCIRKLLLLDTSVSEPAIARNEPFAEHLCPTVRNSVMFASAHS